MKVSFSFVREKFLGDHPISRGSNGPALWNLDKADEQFLGQWSYRRLSLSEVLGAVLSHHDHWKEQSEVQLVPSDGLTVAQAITHYKSLQDYSVTNPLCRDTIEYVRNSRTDVFLSTRPIDTDDFRPLNRFEPPHLFVLDGLHRLIARGLAGDYDAEQLEHKPVNAFIAGE